MGERAEKIKSFFKNNIGYIIATLETLAYIFISTLYVDETGKTLKEIIGSGFVFYILQITLVSLFRHQGIIEGENDERVLNTYELHGDKVDEVADYMDALEQWCEEENSKNYKRMRRRILASAGLKYADYFKEEGIIEPFYIDPDKMSFKWRNRFIRDAELKKIRMYNKAVNLKLSKLDATSLTSGNAAQEDKFAFGKSKKEFLRVKGISDIIIRSLPALFFGLYGFRRIEDWTLANLAWTIFQAAVAYSSAVPQIFAAKSYIIDDYRSDVVKKIRLLDQFKCDLYLYPEKYGRIKEDLNVQELMGERKTEVSKLEEPILEEVQNGEANATKENDELHG